MKKKKAKSKENNVKVNNLPLIIAFFIFLVLVGRLVQLSLAKEVDGINLQNFAKNRTTKKITLSELRRS